MTMMRRYGASSLTLLNDADSHTEDENMCDEPVSREA